jgi:hypothetical protein
MSISEKGSPVVTRDAAPRIKHGVLFNYFVGDERFQAIVKNRKGPKA